MAAGVSVVVPLVASVPLHAPLAVHEVAFVEVHVRVVLAPSVIAAGFAERVTVGLGWLPLLPPQPAAMAISADPNNAHALREKGLDIPR